MQKKRVQKLITFSPQLATHIEDKAKQLGVSFPEYIRSLAVQDIKEDYIIAPPHLEKQIGASLQEFSEEKGSPLDPQNPDDLKELFGE